MVGFVALGAGHWVLRVAYSFPGPLVANHGQREEHVHLSRAPCYLHWCEAALAMAPYPDQDLVLVLVLVVDCCARRGRWMDTDWD